MGCLSTLDQSSRRLPDFRLAVSEPKLGGHRSRRKRLILPRNSTPDSSHTIFCQEGRGTPLYFPKGGALLHSRFVKRYQNRPQPPSSAHQKFCPKVCVFSGPIFLHLGLKLAERREGLQESHGDRTRQQHIPHLSTNKPYGQNTNQKRRRWKSVKW